ncbi:MAG: undecaprenyldiphospho-muramoylpentapeptide beta-N-acetylglucosaminyltransferase [Thermodesulfobacteriota bacterium]|nr:undecaprenyldiphospho-muramoylpentapeptide beta-N-acetylglucosaminyltransferase [Thermodesulfobacteriota bacterium]
MRILITAGGTGGHIMPAMAIADALRARNPKTELLFVGTNRGMEEQLARRFDVPFKAIEAMGIKGKSPIGIIKALPVNMRAFVRALGIMHGFRPQVVIGTGGYITGMVVLAGRLMGARCIIHEQNSVPGLTNRILSRLVHKVFTAFPDDGNNLPPDKTVLTGNPVRSAILAADRDTHRSCLFIMGGSLGASSINHAAAHAIEILRDEGIDIPVIHQCGEHDLSWLRQQYRQYNIEVEVHAFIDDMAKVYKKTLLAFCRAGGLSLAELSVSGIPALMVPLPWAADDHQRKNAQYLASRGGGWIIEEHDLDPGGLALRIKDLLDNPDRLEHASAAMKHTGLGRGADRIAEEILNV